MGIRPHICLVFRSGLSASKARKSLLGRKGTILRKIASQGTKRCACLSRGAMGATPRAVLASWSSGLDAAGAQSRGCTGAGQLSPAVDYHPTGHCPAPGTRPHVLCQQQMQVKMWLLGSALGLALLCSLRVWQRRKKRGKRWCPLRDRG